MGMGSVMKMVQLQVWKDSKRRRAQLEFLMSFSPSGRRLTANMPTYGNSTSLVCKLHVNI
ncbi:uncharacterized protein SEPMUDRAFT_150318 [Sphaerulina musiva SO2202]|uniref:Uncharacterized protein n=1 Tax=Sphaerulina musiva (strain SO2202) TaxID=692275 RepID=M3D1J4_SPHMS|nr:uncharacterized protein SEPMUDRAFT_150318 [Sphaerulina musiva SO2202]EMF11368.1 hypothetical protein SEPMUDRAFT_150318 [Sphaerulina musiva SO2202]